MTDRLVHTLWCDDIRQEVGNKPSFMGAYIAGLGVGALPALLPRLCMFTWITTPVERPIHELVLRVVRDDGQVLAEVKPEGMAAGAGADAQLRRGSTRRVVMSGIAIAPLEIPVGCRYLQVVVEADGEKLKGPQLWVEVNAELVASIMNQPPRAAQLAVDQGT